MLIFAIRGRVSRKILKSHVLTKSGKPVCTFSKIGNPLFTRHRIYFISLSLVLSLAIFYLLFKINHFILVDIQKQITAFAKNIIRRKFL